MLCPCPSIEEVYEDRSEEENNPPILPKISRTATSSLKQGLELLTDDQLQKLMIVVAKDMRFKYDLFLKLREQHKLVKSLQTIANKNHVLNSSYCFTCGKPGSPTNGWLRFSIRRRLAALVECCSESCSHRICLNCAKISAPEKPVCVYCWEDKKLEYKKKEWNVLMWPMTQECFGWSKYNHVTEGSSFAAANWTMRAKLELHLIHLLDGSGVSLDSAQVDFQVSDIILESSRHKLVMALMDYSTSGHFAHIDHAIEDVKQVLRRRSNCIQPCSAASNSYLPSLSYFHLMSNAIISMLLHSSSQNSNYSASSASLRFRRPRREVQEGQMHKGPRLGLSRCSLKSFACGRSAALYVPSCSRTKAALLPCFSELDLSSSTAINTRGVLSPRPVHPNHKYFPVASLRTSRSSLASHLEDVKETPDDLPKLCFELPEPNLCVIPANEDSLPPTPGPLSSPAVLPVENGSPLVSKGHLTIAMEKLIVEVSAGQMVTIRCAIRNAGCEVEVTDSKSPLQLIWYNRRRQIPTTSKTGRIRLSTNQTSSKLEIFDCDAYKDSGDIVCVAVGECVLGGVQAATTRLIVHEDDIAGEEPLFVRPLSIFNPSNISSYSLHCKTIAQGDSLLLKCRVSGLPQPYLKFFVSFGNKPMEVVDSSHEISYIGDLWTLKVDNLKLSSYSINNLPATLTYTSVAMNRIGKCISSIQLTLVEKTRLAVEQQTSL
uniref:Ig-like domain-containing protein n=1 Tax=Ditylenchus dipsaci TaxID=166011 RepID=A0A915EIN6_9BILA